MFTAISLPCGLTRLMHGHDAESAVLPASHSPQNKGQSAVHQIMGFLMMFQYISHIYFKLRWVLMHFATSLLFGKEHACNHQNSHDSPKWDAFRLQHPSVVTPDMSLPTKHCKRSRFQQSSDKSRSSTYAPCSSCMACGFWIFWISFFLCWP